MRQLVIAALVVGVLAAVIAVLYRVFVTIGVPVQNRDFMTVYANSAYILSIAAFLGRFALFTRGY